MPTPYWGRWSPASALGDLPGKQKACNALRMEKESEEEGWSLQFRRKLKRRALSSLGPRGEKGKGQVPNRKSLL